MKTIPPPCPEPEVGRKYWRSLEQLAETPEFNQWLEREFPQGASEWTDPVSRRHFVKIMSASLMLAGIGVAGSGCRRPEEKILPFSRMPENYIHGVPQFFATAMPTRGSAIPLVVRSNDGRPTKIEGNDRHPDSNGGTDRFTQASILNLYDPDRATRFMKGPSVTNPATVIDFLASISQEAQKNGGQGLSFLVERNNSPSRLRLQKQISEKLPQSRWYAFEPVDLDIQRRSASAAFGKSVKPFYKLDAAKVIVSLDCDFIGAEEDAHNNIRRFAQGRRMEKAGDIPNRLYSVESLMTLTGVNADHRLRIPSSAVAQVAAGLAAEIIKDGNLPDFGKPAGVDPRWISECAKDLTHNRGQSLVLAGYRQPLAVHMLAHALNSALGNVGKTVLLHELPESKEGTLAELAAALNGNQVQTLVMLGGNPVYNAPADLDWTKTQRKAKTVLRLGYYEDETFAECDWHIPAAHYLESWGDALTSDGTLVPIQPLIAPLFGGMTELEVLARIAGAKTFSPYEIVQETFATLAGNANVEEVWKKFLHEGFLPNSAAKAVELKLDATALSKVPGPAKAGTPSKDNLEVVFHRDYSLDDGRYNNNGWLQEMPDPITKMVWDNAVLISRKTAGELKVKNGDLVEVKLANRSITGPIWVQPGLADYSLGLPLGYGRKHSGRVGHDVGFNVYPLRTTVAENFAVGATLSPTGKTYTLACTQDHWSMEGRPIIREANLEQYQKHPKFAKSMHEEEPRSGAQPMYPNPFDKVKSQGHHQWGMSIDLNTCVGCSACMMACQSENNVPIVGKDQVRRGREMHWLRIDRYYSGIPEKRKRFDTFNKEEEQQFESWIDDPQVVTQPMMCQHCESAPCENVCPVNATVHDQEGLNLMVYNRCVGTRYCSNNCPYKVRKFNYFDYNKRGIGKNLYFGPLRHRPDDEWDLLKMIKNPDVTVRMRGVMEKCTFCIQRIESAKITQKVKAGASADVIVPTDSFTTACAAACPAGSIVFGNLNDPNSRVSKLKENDRDYAVLDFLLTKPRLTYLAKVRNPNTNMPDHRDAPLSLEYYRQQTDHKTIEEIFEEGGEGHGAPAGEPAEKGTI
jgi:molybdopterin-containing oxidoreductase family iron-sulfur binding subunit